jgi:hypothetical protein
MVVQAVSCEPVSRMRIPALRENTRNFDESGVLRRFLREISFVLSACCGLFPYEESREAKREQQGIASADQ